MSVCSLCLSEEHPLLLPLQHLLAVDAVAREAVNLVLLLVAETRGRLERQKTVRGCRRERRRIDRTYRIFARNVDGLAEGSGETVEGHGGRLPRGAVVPGGRPRSARLQHPHPGGELVAFPAPQILQVLEYVAVMGVEGVRVPRREPLEISPVSVLQRRKEKKIRSFSSFPGRGKSQFRGEFSRERAGGKFFSSGTQLNSLLSRCLLFISSNPNGKIPEELSVFVILSPFFFFSLFFPFFSFSFPVRRSGQTSRESFPDR